MPAPIPYTNNIPNPGDVIAQSQPLILNNFGSLDQQFSVDHKGFSTSDTNYGEHKKVSLISGSDPTALATDPILYAKLSGTTPRHELFMMSPTGDLNTPIQMTFTPYAPTTVTSTPGNEDGTSFLPGGFIIKWGQRSAASNNGVITFLNAFPSNCFTVQVTQNSGTGSSLTTVGTDAITTSNFKFRHNAPAQIPMTYIAIGN